MENKLKPIGKLGLFFGLGLTSHYFGSSHEASTLVSNVLGFSKDLVHAIFSISGHVLTHSIYDSSKEAIESFDEEVNRDLETAIINAYKETLTHIESDIIKEYEIRETKTQKLLRILLNKTNDEYETFIDIKLNILSPILMRLVDDGELSKMLNRNEQLNPKLYLRNIVKESFSSNEFPDILIEEISNKFENYYPHYFLQELKKNDRAKTVYFTQLLQQIVLNTKDINEVLPILNDFAVQAKIELPELIREIKETNQSIKKIKDEFEASQEKVNSKLDSIQSGIDDIVSLNSKNDYSRDLFIKGSYIDATFWKKYKINDPNEIVRELHFFYINPASSFGGIVEKVVANDFYILPNNKIEINQQYPISKKYSLLDDIFLEFEEKQEFRCLIKVTGLGGNGKTTFLWHLAKQYYSEYKTFFLDSFDKESLINISKFIDRDDRVLLFLDSLVESAAGSNLKNFFRYVENFQRVIIVISERSSWLEYFDDKYNFYSSFFYIYEIPFNNCLNRTKIFKKILSLLPIDISTTISKTFLSTKKGQILEHELSLSLVESKYLLLNEIKANLPGIKALKYEWEDWENFTTLIPSYKSLRYLYLFISAFQQFGQRVPINLNFNKVFETTDINFFLINDAIKTFSSGSSPILADEKFVFIRHDMLGEILINNLKAEQLNILAKLLKNFFLDCSDQESIYLFRNIHRRKIFQISPLFSIYLTHKVRVNVLDKYLMGIPEKIYSENEFKCLTELIQTYNEVGDKEKMLQTINRLIDFERGKDFWYGKNMLANFYIDFDIKEKFEEAESILMDQYIRKDPIAFTCLLKLFSKYKIEDIPEGFRKVVIEESLKAPEEVRIEMKRAQFFLDQGDLKSAISIYKDIISKNPNDYHSRTKLSSIFRNLAEESLKAKNFKNYFKLLNRARKLLLITLELNFKNEHTYTELGETLYDLGDIDGAIDYLQKGIFNCDVSFGCKTSLAKIYRKKAEKFKKTDEVEKTEKLLTTSYEILKLLKVDYPYHQPSSLELALTCISFYNLYKRKMKDEIKAGYYKDEIEKTLFPLFFTENRRLLFEGRKFYGIRLLLTFYKKNNYIKEYDNLANEILSATEPDTEFWIFFLDVFEKDNLLEKLFSNLIRSEFSQEQASMIVRKLSGLTVIQNTISISLKKTMAAFLDSPIYFKQATLLSGLYFYSIGELNKSKGVFKRYSQSVTKNHLLFIWQEFINLISINSIPIKISKELKNDFEVGEYCFKETKYIEQLVAAVVPVTLDGTIDAGKLIGDLKHYLFLQFGIAKLKSLNKMHKSQLGYGCFYIYLVLGEIFQRKKILFADDEDRYNKAKSNYGDAVHLGIMNLFSHLEASYNEGATIDTTTLQSNFFERLINNIVDCYLGLHVMSESEIFIERSLRAINNSRISVNKPFYYLQLSKIQTRQKKYILAYNTCEKGLQTLRQGFKFNFEIFKKPQGIRGALYANLAYALHKNWKENNTLIGNKTLKDILELYQRAITVYPRKWIYKSLDQIRSELGV
jgi:hypothetical protein